MVQQCQNQEEKVLKHRRRVEERSIQDFVEWLNMNEFLQSLAYGEKIIKYKNGFHLAIESVKRTKSVVQIVQSYYRDFLCGRAEDEDGNDSDKESDYSSELDSNNEDIHHCKEKCCK